MSEREREREDSMLHTITTQISNLTNTGWDRYNEKQTKAGGSSERGGTLGTEVKSTQSPDKADSMPGAQV